MDPKHLAQLESALASLENQGDIVAARLPKISSKATSGGKIPRACFTIQELLLPPRRFLITSRLLLTAIILLVINIRYHYKD